MPVIETSATLRGNAYADGVELHAFGPADHLHHAAEVYTYTDALRSSARTLLVTILQPEARATWTFDRESDFRDTVRAYVRGVLGMEFAAVTEAWLIWSPGEAQADGEWLTIRTAEAD